MERQIDQLYQPLFLYIKKRVHHQEDAEDLTQEVFYKLSKAENSEVESMKNWVYAIAKNTITDYYRKKKLRLAEVDDIPDLAPQVEAGSANELSKCVGEFINQLPEEYRSIMALAELEGIPQKEIAEQLNMNYVTVRSKIQRGRKKLKALISNCCTVIQGGKGSILDYQVKEKTARNPGCCD